MAEGLGFGKQKLIAEIIKQNWGVDTPWETKKFNYQDVLFIIQEMLEEAGKKYFDDSQSPKKGFFVFKDFVKHLLYRNVANYDSMILLTSEKGTGKSSAAIMMAREWCKLLGIKFDTNRHIAYNNADVMRKIDALDKFEPIVCVTGDTLVTVRFEGEEPINIKIKELISEKRKYQILSYDMNKHYSVFKDAEKTIQTHKSAKVFEVELENGIKIKATEDHLFLTSNGYKSLKDLTEDDEILLGGRESKLEYLKKYREQNREILKEKRNKKYSENPEMFKKRKAAEYQRNKKTYQVSNKLYRKNNKEAIVKMHKKWIVDNYNKYREYYNKRHKILMKTNPNYKIARNLRRRVGLALQEKGLIKDKSIWNYLGCSLEKLKSHIEKQFVDNMSWNNYGEWHIDHIKPCASFNLVEEEEQKKCFNYKNLQPLWSFDNLSKGASQ